MVPVIYILTLPAVDLPVYHTVQVTCTGRTCTHQILSEFVNFGFVNFSTSIFLLNFNGGYQRFRSNAIATFQWFTVCLSALNNIPYRTASVIISVEQQPYCK